MSRGFWKLGYYLDLVYVFKCLVSFSRTLLFQSWIPLDPGVLSPPRERCWIRLGPTPSHLRTVIYRRAPRIWNTLPAHLRNTGCSVEHFKKDLFNYYLHLTIAKSFYDIDSPQTYKSVSIKCHTSRPLNSLLDRMCCWFFIDVLPNSVFALAFLFLSSLSIVILVSCSLCVWSRPLGEVYKSINKWTPESRNEFEVFFSLF